MSEFIDFETYPKDMVTVDSLDDAYEVLQDLKEIAEDIHPKYPLLLLVEIR